jgi:2-oxoglutarate ferredoxin oxidoreductase subunit alpha
MTPVLFLTDSYLANGSGPWRIPEMKDLPEIKPPFADRKDIPFFPYKRDCETLARAWAVPGVPGLEHRIGGLEKTIKGTVSYIPENHEQMVKFRDEKVNRVALKIPDQKVYGPESGDLLLVGWGGTQGYLMTAVRELQNEGYSISLVCFSYIYPLPRNVKEIFSRFKKIVVAELNLGQFADYLRIKHQEFNYKQINKVQGLPFTIKEIRDNCIKILEEK